MINMHRNITGILSHSDLAWVEKLESQIRDESIFEQFDFLFSLSDGVADKNWEEVIDCPIEEMLDMPVMSEDNNVKHNISDNGSRNKNNHELLNVTEKDLDCIDTDDLY